MFGVIRQIVDGFRKWWKKELYSESRLNKRYFVAIVIVSVVVSVIGWRMCDQNCLKKWFCDLAGDEIVHHMQEKADFLGTVVLTLSTIFGALALFLFDSLWHKNFGFTNT